MAKKVVILVVVLAIVAVLAVLTVLNYSKAPSPTETTNPTTTNTTTQPTTGSKSTGTPTNTEPVKPSAQELLKQAPGEKPTQKEMGDYSSKVFQSSVKTDTLDITSCSPNPSVIALSPSQSITVINHDTSAHTLVHGQDINVTVPAQGSKTLTAPSGLGIYGYSCDGTVNGIIFVSK
jgi:hypothetical protein